MNKLKPAVFDTGQTNPVHGDERDVSFELRELLEQHGQLVQLEFKSKGLGIGVLAWFDVGIVIGVTY